MIFELGIGKMPLNEIARAIGAKGMFSTAVPQRIVTDSRQVEEGDIFCALNGKNDGHNYIPEAAKKGAIAVIAEHTTDCKIPHLLSRSTEHALAMWAHIARERQTGCRFIAVTGSVGKTTTKTVIATMLGVRLPVFASQGNYNNALGVPLSLLSIPPHSKVAILELGSNACGEIEHLSRTVAPDDAVITGIGHAHIGAFGSLEATAKEKYAVTSGMRAGGILYIKKGDRFPMGVKDIRTVHTEPYPDVRDIAMASALGFACSIGKNYSLSDSDIKRGIRLAQDSDIRRKIKKCGEITLIDDSYNASPESMLAAFAFLKNGAGKRKILVLGDMLELGCYSERLHRETGYAASFADAVFLFGQYANVLASAIEERKSGISYVLRGNTPQERAQEIYGFLQENDALLFKASRELSADKIADALYDLLLQNKDV